MTCALPILLFDCGKCICMKLQYLNNWHAKSLRLHLRPHGTHKCKHDDILPACRPPSAVSYTFVFRCILGEHQKGKSTQGKSKFWTHPFSMYPFTLKGISKKDATIYKLPSGGGAAPPGPAPALRAGPGPAPGPDRAGRPCRCLVFCIYWRHFWTYPYMVKG